MWCIELEIKFRAKRFTQVLHNTIHFLEVNSTVDRGIYLKPDPRDDSYHRELLSYELIDTIILSQKQPLKLSHTHGTFNSYYREIIRVIVTTTV